MKPRDDAPPRTVAPLDASADRHLQEIGVRAERIYAGRLLDVRRDTVGCPTAARRRASTSSIPAR